MKDAHLGTDLAVLAYPAAHDASGADLLIRRRPDRARGAQPGAELCDLAVCSARSNLAQALIMRLLTPLGSLAALGHAGYGSRLHELVGRGKTSATRSLCRLFVLQTIAQEPRVQPQALEFSFELQREQPDTLHFFCSVQPIDNGDPVALSLEVAV